MSKTADTAVILHLYYTELWEEIRGYLNNLDQFDLYVSVTDNADKAVVNRITQAYPQAHIVKVENRGRDVAPFMKIFADISSRYEYICKIHSKKSTHYSGGTRWRQRLYDELLGSKTRVGEIKQAFADDKELGLIGPAGFAYTANDHALPLYRDILVYLASGIGLNLTSFCYSFFAGSMFWFRTTALAPLLRLGITQDMFEAESGQTDATLAHVLERFFPLAALAGGYSAIDTGDFSPLPGEPLAEPAAASDGTPQPAKGAMDAAIEQFRNGLLNEAYSAFRDILDGSPNHPTALTYLGLIALSAHFYDDAEVFFGNAVSQSPDAVAAREFIGRQCLELGQLGPAEQYLSAAIAAQPKRLSAHLALCEVRRRQNRQGEALQSLRSTFGAKHPDIQSCCAQLARELGDLETEYAVCRDQARSPELHGRALELLAWRDDTSAADMVKEARRFAASHYPAPKTAIQLGRRKRLRVGFVVGELASDTARYRLEPLLLRLDPQKFDTVAFVKSARLDERSYTSETAHRMHLIADYWQVLIQLDPDAAAKVIREAQTDILINLEGYGCPSALEALATRAAPIQINWSAPPLTSGLANVDCIVGDPVVAPNGRQEPSHNEPSLLLPWSYAAYDLPEMRHTLPPRGQEEAPFTFGCLVPIHFISPKTLLVWCEILRNNPSTRLLLNSFDAGAAARRHAEGKLADGGIPAEQVLWAGATDGPICCESWRQVHLGLCPLTGDSSYVALLGAWMGVPSIATPGATPWGAIPALTLQQLGLEAFVAQSAENYVELATHWAREQDTLKSLGTSLHERVKQSPLSDTQSFAEAFGAALEDIWLKKGGTLENRA